MTPLPAGQPLARVLRRFQRRLRHVALQQLARGQRPDLSAWVRPLADALLPVYAPLYQRGGSACLARVARRVASVRQQKAYTDRRGRRYVVKELSGRPVLSLIFDVFNPRILEAVAGQVMDFCRATLDTMAREVTDAYAAVRRELAAGLAHGEAQARLNQRVGAIFDDPGRAARIAQTEAARAVHGGQLLAAKESGVVRGKRWLASADACDLCRSLAARGTIPLDEPFHVFPKGGPYAVVMHPGAHPHCFCSMIEEMDMDAVRGHNLPRLVRA